MKKVLRFMLMPVLACGLAVAQSSMSSDTDKDKHHHMNSGKTKTMTGCVQEKDGKYWLMDKKHPNGVELMSSEDMKAHVGHKVTVSGTMSKMDNDAAMSGDSSMSKEDHEKMEKAEKKDKHEKHEHGGMRMMNVNNMQMVSDTCNMK
jgi:hypothetical protein